MSRRNPEASAPPVVQRIAFLGDVCLELDPDAWADAAVPDLRRLLGADHIVANFESTIDGETGGRAIDGKICLSAPERNLLKLKEMGISAVGVANNHIADYGDSAARHTIVRLQSVFGRQMVFGWRGQPAITIAPGLSIVGVCFPETNPRSNDTPYSPVVVSSVEDVDALSPEAGNRPIVYAHWGEEHISIVAPELARRVDRLCASGTPLVIGAHSHVRGPIVDEVSRRACFGLGNFLFRMIPKKNARMLGRNRKGLVPVYAWDGRSLRLDTIWQSGFDSDFNLKLRRIGKSRRRTIAALLLAMPAGVQAVAYKLALKTLLLRLGAAKLLTGVERPSLGKVRTAAQLLIGRGPTGWRGE